VQSLHQIFGRDDVHPCHDHGHVQRHFKHEREYGSGFGQRLLLFNEYRDVRLDERKRLVRQFDEQQQ
jgi:hypothetical protein